MTSRPPPLPRQGVFGDAGALMVGSVVNGLAAYAFVALGTRTFGAAAFAPLSVLWTFWALSVAAFTFPVQHWIIRTVEVDGHEGSVRREVPALVAANVAASLALAAIALVWRERLFGSGSPTWPTLVFAVGVGSVLAGYVRGILAGRKRFVATAVAIGGENLLRLAAGVALVAIGVSVGWFATCLAVGPVIAVAWPGAFRLRRGAPHRPHRLVEFLGGLAGGALVAQVALNAGPAVLAAIGGAPQDVTALFATLALFRAPYLVALGLATLVTGPLTALVVAGDEDRLRRLRGSFLLVAAAATGAAAVLGVTAGPAIVDLIFGGGVAPGGGIVAAIGAGSALALAALISMLMLAARGWTTAIVTAWSRALAVGLIVLLVLRSEPLPAVAAAFFVTELAALTLMVRADLRAGRQSMRSRTT